MNLKIILAASALTTFLTTTAQSQSEKYSFSFGGSYVIPKSELKKSFNFLKGLEVSFAMPITEKSSMGITYYSGYRWEKEPVQSIELEPKINADGLSINYNHNLKIKSVVNPFYEVGIGYERFILGMNENQKRIIESTKGETLDFGGGVKVNISKKKNKELYFGIKEEFFIPNSKTSQKYSNTKINAGINFKKYKKNK
jgi:hypothetical protein